jgi:hypothetical protein
MDLLTVADVNYFDIVQESIRRFSAFYPDGRMWVYDMGLHASQRTDIQKHPHVEVVTWRFRGDGVGRLLDRALPMRRIDATDMGPLRKLANKLSREWREWVYMQKPYLIRHFLESVESPRFVYLDGDAVLNARLPAFDEYDFDVGVTLREDTEDPKDRGIYYGLNSGVILFNTHRRGVVPFIDAWITRAHSCKLPFAEQTALSLLIEEGNPRLFDRYYSSGSVSLNQHRFDITVLPCSEYNYWHLENGYTDENRVLHFKSAKKAHFREYLEDE